MDLFKTLKIIKNKIIVVVIATLVGAGLGLSAFYLYPKTYYATGSVFVRRTIYPYAEDHFTYEGYYGQQAAVSYTNSIMGLIEGVDLQAKSLRDLEIEVNEESLRKMSRKIRAKRTGPQIITITTKEKSPEEAKNLWKTISSNTVSVVNGISSTSDPYVGVVMISENPILREDYRNELVFALIGAGVSIITATGVLTTTSYVYTNKKGVKK